MLGAEPHGDDPDADLLREREALDVVATIRTAVAEQWSVRDGDDWRPARLGDICILLPARTSLGFLETALDAAGIPYRAETSSLVYGSREVRDLLGVLRAVDDPTDALALGDGAALVAVRLRRRRPLHVPRRSRRPLRPHPSAAGRSPGGPSGRGGDDVPRGAAPASARGWRRASCSSASSRTGTCSSSARPPAASATSPGASGSSWTRRAPYWEATSGTLREYLAWALRQGTEGARVVETVLPETDDDAVRIMTVHGAKGLEFPIVIASGMTTRAAPRRGGVQVLFPSTGGCEIRLALGHPDRPVRAAPPGRRGDGLPREVAAPLRRVHARDGPPRRVRAPEGAQRSVTSQSTWTHAELLWNAAQGASFTEGVAPAPTPPRGDERAGRAAAGSRDVGGRARAGVRARLATSVRRRDHVGPARRRGARRPIPDWRRTVATSSCRRGTRAATAPRSVEPSTRCCRPSTSRPAPGSTTAAAAQAAAEGVLGQEATIAALVRAALASDDRPYRQRPDRTGARPTSRSRSRA